MIQYKTRPNLFTLLDRWEVLGNTLHVNTNYMAYARKFRSRMQKEIHIGKRTVYSSGTPLCYIQQRIGALLGEAFSRVPNNEVALAYRKDVSACAKLSEYAGSYCLIKTDIRHYYDNISYSMLEKTLVNLLGFTERGARLIASYCTVWNGQFSSLQQGSAASPVLANLVGNYYLDNKILHWLKTTYPQVDCTYIRYSDNLALFVKNEPPAGFVQAYQAYVNHVTGEAELSTHSWSVITNNNPRRHQEFLGVVLNSVANIERHKRDSLRATMFNVCTRNSLSEIKRFFKKTGQYVIGARELDAKGWYLKFRMTSRGYASYASNINEKFGLRMKKLSKAFELICEKRYMLEQPVEITPTLFQAIKQYRQGSVTLEDYASNIASAIQ